MPIIYNGTTLSTVKYNGTTLDKVIYNGVTVFESWQTTPITLYDGYVEKQTTGSSRQDCEIYSGTLSATIPSTMTLYVYDTNGLSTVSCSVQIYGKTSSSGSWTLIKTFDPGTLTNCSIIPSASSVTTISLGDDLTTSYVSYRALIPRSSRPDLTVKLGYFTLTKYKNA